MGRPRVGWSLLPTSLTLVLVSVGCLGEDAPTTIVWEVRNDSSAVIAYTLILEGGRVPHWINGTAAAEDVRHHEVSVSAVQLEAEARLRDEPRRSAGVPFAVDGLCAGYVVTATWDGQTWAVDAQATDCT